MYAVYSYDAFCLKFTGKERDTESGLDMFGARYYGSSLGRFMTPDWSGTPSAVPYAKLDNPQSLNLYAYVGNNPLVRIDKDGHCWSWLQGACNLFQKAYYGVFTDYGFKTHTQVTEVNEQNRQWLIDHNVVTPGKNGRVAQAFDLLGTTNTVGAPFLRVLCEGAGTTDACSCEATPPDPGTKSSPILHSRAPARLRPKDKSDNCSTATVPVRRPSLASPDCDAYTAASRRASSSSIR
jgi:RHS repeat-associated protein